MPVNDNTYNTRLTDETLEKRFRDTFRAQGGAELVDDLYASGVIVPVVDFTAAAEGSSLREDLQKAIDHSITATRTVNGSNTIINTTGFWLVKYQVSALASTSDDRECSISITDGLSSKRIVEYRLYNRGTTPGLTDIEHDQLIIFVNTGESVVVNSNFTTISIHTAVRQIADVSGNLTNPSGFSFS